MTTTRDGASEEQTGRIDPKRSACVLIGVSDYSDLPELRAVRNNLAELSSALEDKRIWGIEPRRIRVVENPSTSRELFDPIYEMARVAVDTLIVYYAGHGHIDFDDDRLLLTLTGSVRGRPDTAVRYRDLRRAIRECAARRRVVILDCCYSGRALEEGMSSPEQTVRDAVSLSDVRGSYVMTSTARDREALALDGEDLTAFTGELADVLGAGVPGGPERLGLNMLFDHVKARLRGKERPEPQYQDQNRVGELHFVRNRALDPPPPPPPPRSRFWDRYPRTVRAIGAGLAAATLLGGGVGLVWYQRTHCAWGIPEVKATPDAVREECVGVTDSFAFEPRFQRVMDALERENRFATQGGDGTYVTVAFLGALTNPDARVVHQLEGAVVGLHRANQEQLVGDRPRIRMVLANMDSAESQWRQVTDDLLERVDNDERLVAVAGLGLSQRQTVFAAQRLRTKNLAMVMDIVTDGGINKATVNGLARVNPRIEDEVVALSQYLEGERDLRSAMLVSSSKEDDFYARSLSDAFKRFTGPYWRAGGSVEYPFGANPGNEFSLIVSNLCSERPPDMIFYAGRGADLPTFIENLSNRTCHPARITVVTGSDAVRLIVDSAENRPADAALTSTRNPISLIYSPLAEPAVLGDADRNPAKAQYDKFQASFQALDFDVEHLRTGWSVMAHDAVLTTALAIRRAAPTSEPPRPENVRDTVYLLSSPFNSVPGASGVIVLNSTTGNRSGLQMPVLLLRPGSDPEILGVFPPPSAQPSPS